MPDSDDLAAAAGERRVGGRFDLRGRDAPRPAAHQPHGTVGALPGAAVLDLEREARAAGGTAPPGRRRRESRRLHRDDPCLRSCLPGAGGGEHRSDDLVGVGHRAIPGHGEHAVAVELLRPQRGRAPGDHDRATVSGEPAGELARGSLGLGRDCAGHQHQNVGRWRARRQAGSRGPRGAPSAASLSAWLTLQPTKVVWTRRRPLSGHRRAPRARGRSTRPRCRRGGGGSRRRRPRPPPPAPRAGRPATTVCGCAAPAASAPAYRRPRASIGRSAMLATSTSATGSSSDSSVASASNSSGTRPLRRAFCFGLSQRLGIVVERIDGGEPQPQRGQRQHARAGAGIEQRAARQRSECRRGPAAWSRASRCRTPCRRRSTTSSVSGCGARPRRPHGHTADRHRLVEAPPTLLPAALLGLARTGARASAARRDRRRPRRLRRPARRSQKVSTGRRSCQPVTPRSSSAPTASS